MDKAQKKKLWTIVKSLEDIRTELDSHLSLAGDAVETQKTELTSFKDELQEKYDAMSETAQEGDKGIELSDLIDKLETLEDTIDETKTALDDWLPLDELIDGLKELDTE
jgi:hypothetical protein